MRIRAIARVLNIYYTQCNYAMYGSYVLSPVAVVPMEAVVLLWTATLQSSILCSCIVYSPAKRNGGLKKGMRGAPSLKHLHNVMRQVHLTGLNGLHISKQFSSTVHCYTVDNECTHLVLPLGGWRAKPEPINVVNVLILISTSLILPKVMVGSSSSTAVECLL